MTITVALLGLALNYSTIAPPWQYRDSNGANIQFVNDHELLANCGLAVACVKLIGETKIIYVLNPCKVLKKEDYSTILCHELGHVNGWKHEEN